MRIAVQAEAPCGAGCGFAPLGRSHSQLWAATDLVAWRATYIYRKFTLRDNLVLAADQTAGIVARCDVAELNVMRQAAEE